MSKLHKTIPLDQALRFVQDEPAFVVPDELMDIDIWSPWHKLPIGVRRSVHAHRAQIQALMDSGAAEVCPSRNLHRQFWKYQGKGRYQCEKCHHFIRWGIC